MQHNMTVLLVVCGLGLSSGGNAEESALLAEDNTLLTEEALSEEDLSGQRGEGIDDLTYNKMELDGSNHGNSVMNSITGENFIGNTAFNGASGMFGVIQNSGNNVLIQKATIINIAVD